jgi:hypothetical protein
MATYKSGLVRRKLVFEGRFLVEGLKELVRLAAEKKLEQEAVSQFEIDVDAFVENVKDWRRTVLEDLPTRVV